MTDEFHARIPEILSRRILINSTVVGNIINISNLSSFDNTYSTGKFLPIDLQIKDFLGRIAENELEKRIFENDIYSKNTYSETLPLYKNLIQRTYTTLFNEIPKSILNGTVNSESVNNTSEVANNLKSMSPDVNYGNNVSTKVQQQYSGLPVNTVYRPVVMIDQQMIQSSVTSRQNFPVNTYYKVR